MDNHNLLNGFDCRHFIGEKPCKFKLECKLDASCPKYSPQGKRILIIKLLAIGDVIRTTPVLSALKEKYPESRITWLTHEKSAAVLEDNEFIDRLLILNLESSLMLSVEKFDMLLSLDKDFSSTSLATLVNADEKLGFALADNGNLCCLNKESEYMFMLGFSDQLKFYENKKSYQQLIFEAMKFDVKYGEYSLQIPQKYLDYGKSFFEKHGVKHDRPVIGINTGAGERFATKRWSIEGFVELINMLNKEFDAVIVLLGGPEEVDRNNEIISKVSTPIINSECNHTIKEFIGVLGQCDMIITGDTLALHLAIGIKKPVVSIFTSTCEQEIDLYGRGVKLGSSVDCSPCYLGSCSKAANQENAPCVNDITAKSIFNACRNVLANLQAGGW